VNQAKLRAMWSLYRKDIRYYLFIAFLGIFIYSTWALPMNVAGGWFSLKNADSFNILNDPDDDRYEYSSYEDINGEIVESEEDDYYMSEWEDIFKPIPEFNGASPFVLMIPMAMIHFILVLIVFDSINYTREITTGAIRTLMKYRVNMRDIMISKMGSTLTVILVFFGLTMLLGLIILLTLGIFVLEFIVIGIAVILFIVGNYMFFYALSAIIMSFRAKGQIARPLSLWLLGNMILIAMTETFVCFVALFLSGINNTVYSRPGLANIMYLSPFHFLGRFINFVMLGDPFHPLDFIWVPVFVGVLIAGYILGKKVYPDVFISETA